MTSLRRTQFAKQAHLTEDAFTGAKDEYCANYYHVPLNFNVSDSSFDISPYHVSASPSFTGFFSSHIFP